MSKWSRDTDELKLEIADIVGANGPDVDVLEELKRRKEARH